MADNDKQSTGLKPVYVNGILTPTGRVSFPHLAMPDTVGKFAKGKYKLTLLMKPSEVDGMREAALECAKQAFPGVSLTDIQMPFRDGNEKAKDPKNARYAGFTIITVTTKKQPPTIDMGKQPIDPKEVYAGCWARCIVCACSYSGVETVVDSATRQRKQVTSYGVTFLLDKVQKVKDDERWGGKGTDDFPDDDEAVARFNPPVAHTVGGHVAPVAPADDCEV